jgi:hypothetical protein
MNDKLKVIIGLIVFFAIFSYPFWNNSFKNEYPEHKPVLSAEAEKAKECVRSKDYMTKEHMQLLDIWRDKVVRSGERVYKYGNGKEYNMSLSNTCLGCHTNKAEFCDRCHDYASVKPYCWDCHIDSKENK